MKGLRIVLAALAVAVFGTAWGMITCGWLFSWVYRLSPITVWRAPVDMTPMFWTINVMGHLALSFIFIGVLLWISRGLPGKRLLKGISYGFVVWLVGILPGMFATAMFMTVNPIWPIYTVLNQLIALPIAGLIAAAIALPRAAAE
jgi:hypothetical protein